MALDLNGLGYPGKRVVVTGAASGMGEAVAGIVGELGAEVHAVDIKKPTVAHDAFSETDLRDPAAIDQTIAEITAGGTRPVDRLFNCAGISQVFGPMPAMLVNFLGLRHLTENLLPHIADGGAIASISSGAGMGYLINMANVFALLDIPDHAEAKAWCESHPEVIKEGYSFSKECIIVWTMKRCVELAEQRRIRINCIGPGPTDTAFMPDVIKDMGQEYFDNFPKPLHHRNATAEEQAWPLVYLNSDVASIVTGQIVWTDQGLAGGLMTGQIDPNAMIPANMQQ
jgi:NAD(P)-dependent dehydrogenase (short-subunit alcohol dehydrogenase family)